MAAMNHLNELARRIQEDRWAEMRRVMLEAADANDRALRTAMAACASALST